VVRQGSAKPLFAGSIPAHASNYFNKPKGMSMSYLVVSEIVLAILLSACILIQQQGSGLGGAFGGEGNIYRSKRGLEKWLFYATIILGIAFFGVAIAAVIIK
jgi:preprotein translocase subunit SecG